MTPDTTDFNSLNKKQLVELVITKYNDCFRLEEENRKLREELSKKSMGVWFDKKANNIFMEEDTLQELRDLGEI